MNMSTIGNKENVIEESLHYVARGDAGDNTEVDLWKRLPSESSKAYHAFCQYLRDGHWRSMKKVAAKLGKPPRYEKQLWKWCSKFDWITRTQAFDTYVDELLMRQYLEEQLAAFERQIEHARIVEEKVFNELMSRDLKDLKPSELTRLYDIAGKIERDTRGLKSEIGNRISDTFAFSRSQVPRNVIKQVRQELEEDYLEKSENLFSEGFGQGVSTTLEIVCDILERELGEKFLEVKHEISKKLLEAAKEMRGNSQFSYQNMVSH
jgi:hypothetical protein